MQLFIAIFFFCLALAATGARAQECNREHILQYLALLDTDHNGNLTAAEFDAWHDVCGNDPTEMNGAEVIAACDVNGDGVLNEQYDYDGPLSCMTVDALSLLICAKGRACVAYHEWLASFDERKRSIRTAVAELKLKRKK